MMEKDYLIILGSHVDTQKKRDIVIKTLEHFKDENIDVCLLTHCPNFLDDLSKHCKFVIYDNNNTYLTLQDYIDNSHLIPTDLKFKYGAPSSIFYHSFGETIINIPGSPHSKSALSLLRNGIIVGKHNNYKWVVYLEYDIPIPKNGYKDFIETHLSELNQNNKDFFYYRNTTNNFNFLWGGFVIFKTETIFNDNKFIINPWYKTNKEWIENWYLGFFESIIEQHLINEHGVDKILHKDIVNHFKDFWDCDNYHNLSQFKFEDTYHVNKPSFVENFKVYLFPQVNNGSKKIYLYYYSDYVSDITINKLIVYSKRKLYYNIINAKHHPNSWSFYHFEVDDLTNDDMVEMYCESTCNGQILKTIQNIPMNNYDYINNLMRINFY